MAEQSLPRTSASRLPVTIRRRRDTGEIIHRSHPNGWTIKQERREPESQVGRMNGQADHPGPMTWWEVTRLGEKRERDLFGGLIPKRSEAFNTLREARAWCDERSGWPRWDC